MQLLQSSQMIEMIKKSFINIKTTIGEKKKSFANNSA
jgi:hypothetical protein